MTMLIFCLLPLALGSAIPKPGAILSEYQDSLGQYSFGYSSPDSARSEIRSADGRTRGAFSFVDTTGVIQTARYTADSESGFRIEATYLPEAPKPVQDTPEVIAAREDHLKAIAEAEKIAGAVHNDIPGRRPLEDVHGASMESTQHLIMKMSEKKHGAGMEEKQVEVRFPRTPEEEKMEPSEKPQAALVKTSFVMPSSKVNLQSRIELQPMVQASSAPITAATQGMGRHNLRGASFASIISASSGYTPYSSIVVAPYPATIYPHAHYPFVPITHIY